MDYHLADFLGLNHTITKHKDLFFDIKKILLRKYPFEHGGLVDLDFNVLEYESSHSDCHNYFPNHSFFIDLVRKRHLFSFHSHLHFLDPSENDLFFIKNYNIPIIIYSLNYDTFLGVNTRYERYCFSWNI